MSLLSTLRLGPPHAHDERAAQLEAVRAFRRKQAEQQGWPRLELDDLRFGPLSGMVTHEPTGQRYKARGGELDSPLYGGAVAYYERPDGTLGFLEDAPPGASW